MSNQANDWASRIRWQAVRDEPVLHAIFPDDSALTISTSGDARRMGTKSPPGSQAHEFAEALQPKTGFDVGIKGLVFTFRDGSRLDLDLEGSTLDLSDGPDA